VHTRTHAHTYTRTHAHAHTYTKGGRSVGRRLCTILLNSTARPASHGSSPWTSLSPSVSLSFFLSVSLSVCVSGLEFVAATFERSLANPIEELQVSFTEAYGKTLKKHHSFLVAPIFSVRTRPPPPLPPSTDPRMHKKGPSGCLLLGHGAPHPARLTVCMYVYVGCTSLSLSLSFSFCLSMPLCVYDGGHSWR
jgi:hypothetical protein